jgi:hypothetical protein
MKVRLQRELKTRERSFSSIILTKIQVRHDQTCRERRTSTVRR